ncbi:MAG: lipopolysaccharide export system permease protein [Rhodospirillaceae bacterium]|nr:MAG: lipopolysaccharide export system permease protein [Rhodospirillaceae bacterium]
MVWNRETVQFFLHAPRRLYYTPVAMRLITRYILRHLGIGTVLVAVGLACILWLSQSVRFLEMIVRKSLSILDFAYLTLLLLPNFMVIILPIALFAVTLITYNRLIADRELIVLRASGASDLQLGATAFILAVGMTGVCFTLTLYGVPKSVELFREMQWAIRHNVSAVFLREGTFTEVIKGLTVYVRSRSPEGELLDVLVHDKRIASRTMTMIAERGALVFNENGPRVLMINGNQQETWPGDGRFSILYFDSYSLDIGRLNEKEHIRFRDARERSLRELFTASEETGLSREDVYRFHIEAHQRLVQPLFNVSFVAVALAVLLTAPFNRRGQTTRMIAAVGIITAIETAALGVANLAPRYPGVIPLLYVIALLPPGIALYLLRSAPYALSRGEVGR